MNLQKLKLSHFRNYQSASFCFEPCAVHVLYGRNAQGKTNILEAVYFLSHLRSWRTLKTGSLCEYDQTSFILEGQLENGGRKEVLKAVYASPKKYLQRNDKPVGSFSSFVGILNAVLFCPDDLSLFSAPPAKRRQFMDMELVKLSHAYTGKLSSFQKLLKQRSVLLKEWKPDEYLLETVTDQMIELQKVLIAQRSSFARNLEQKAQQVLPLFSDGQETLSIRYKTCADPDGDIEAQLRSLYEKNSVRDRQTKTTTAGAHKDDLEFYLDGRLITQTASQGQRRSVILALKLGLCEMIREKTGQYPILLLDDVFSELDDFRKAALMAALPEEMQIFITTAEKMDPSLFDREVHFYTVDHGKMKEGIYDV